MDYSNVNILLLAGGARQAMPIMKDLHDLGCRFTTISFTKLDVGYTSRFPTKKLLFYEPHENFEQRKRFVEPVIKSGDYDIVIPLSDVMTEFISLRLDEFNESISTFVPDYTTFMKAYDKQKTMEICQENNLPCPITKVQNETLESYIYKVGFPFVIKPRSACGSVGFHCIKSQEQLERLLDEGIVNTSDFVFQEYIDQNGEQYNVHLFMDENDNIVFSVPTRKCRWYPIDGGSSTYCMTINRPDLTEICTQLLKLIHWRGYCEIELIEDPKTHEPKIMEINGRTSACVKICQLYGINIAKSMIELATHSTVEPIDIPFHDVRMRCIHTDLLWFIKSPNRFKSTPSWFNNRHTHDQIFSIADPLPFVTFSLQSIKRYRKESDRRRR